MNSILSIVRLLASQVIWFETWSIAQSRCFGTWIAGCPRDASGCVCGVIPFVIFFLCKQVNVLGQCCCCCRRKTWGGFWVVWLAVLLQTSHAELRFDLLGSLPFRFQSFGLSLFIAADFGNILGIPWAIGFFRQDFKRHVPKLIFLLSRDSTNYDRVSLYQLFSTRFSHCGCGVGCLSVLSVLSVLSLDVYWLLLNIMRSRQSASSSSLFPPDCRTAERNYLLPCCRRAACSKKKVFMNTTWTRLNIMILVCTRTDSSRLRSLPVGSSKKIQDDRCTR
jgi:hypothetical protein